MSFLKFRIQRLELYFLQQMKVYEFLLVLVPFFFDLPKGTLTTIVPNGKGSSLEYVKTEDSQCL
jgi:hypothetical protein